MENIPFNNQKRLFIAKIIPYLLRTCIKCHIFCVLKREKWLVLQTKEWK